MIDDKDLPALFHAYDQSAERGQALYKRLVAMNFILTILSASLLVYTFHIEWVKRVLPAISSLLLFGTLFLFWFIRTKRYEQNWVQARAAAESVKNLSWLYMSCAEPYSKSLSAYEADHSFIRDLSSILETNNQVERTEKMANITERMRQVRAMDLSARANVYVKDRINRQWQWYIDRSEEHGTKERIWFGTIIVLQFLAVIASISLIVFPASSFRPTGLFTTFASLAVAWLQMRRYQEVSHSYAVSAQQLGVISDERVHATDEQKLSMFVEKAEAVILKEHSVWVIRLKS